MDIGAGHYLIEFLGHDGEVLSSGVKVCKGSYALAQFAAEEMVRLVGTGRYRILRCMMVSDEKERWEPQTKERRTSESQTSESQT